MSRSLVLLCSCALSVLLISSAAIAGVFDYSHTATGVMLPEPGTILLLAVGSVFIALRRLRARGR